MNNRQQRLIFHLVPDRYWAFWFITFLVLLGALYAKEKSKENNFESFALLKGTCFDEKGFGFQGVAITVELPASPDTKSKAKKWLATTDARGEFALRLPAGKNQFLVKASRKKYQPLERLVSFTGDERQDLLFNLEPLSHSK